MTWQYLDLVSSTGEVAEVSLELDARGGGVGGIVFWCLCPPRFVAHGADGTFDLGFELGQVSQHGTELLLILSPHPGEASQCPLVELSPGS